MLVTHCFGFCVFRTSMNDALPQPLGAGKSHHENLNIQDFIRAYSCLFELGLMAEVLEGVEVGGKILLFLRVISTL